MMTHETQLKLMASLDGELPGGEARRVAELLDRDPEAKALYDELNATKTALVGNETEFKVPESREFYWSNIRRQIERAEVADVTRTKAPSLGWLRFIAPAGALAALALAIGVSLKMSTDPGTDPAAASVGHEIVTPTDEVSSISFRSETAAMTVVWVDSRRRE